MIMFYAPWCGYCKQLKPDYSSAATELKPLGYILAAIDVNRPENSVIRKQYNITGFPTLLYYEWVFSRWLAFSLIRSINST